jgi:cytochrome o ubiquinol oxidase operon protein cyoD
MSHPTEDPTATPHAAEDATGGSAATLRTYTIGFVLAVILTIIPFALVMYAGLSKGAALMAIGIAGFIQLLVHLYFFLHLDVAREHRANTMTGLFAVLILGVLVGGTVWLFYSLHARTMLGMG